MEAEAGTLGHAALLVATLVLLCCWPPAPATLVECPDPQRILTHAAGPAEIACAPDAGAAGAAASPRHRLEGAEGILFGRPLDVNRATADVLQVLPGIGPSRAASIVEARARRPFRSLRELEGIRGIGPKTVAGLAEWARVGGDHE